jgi:hypothetical protein
VRPDADPLGVHEVGHGVDVQPQGRGAGQLDERAAPGEVPLEGTRAEGRCDERAGPEQQRRGPAALPVRHDGGQRGRRTESAVEIDRPQRGQIAGQHDDRLVREEGQRRRAPRRDGAVERPGIGHDHQAGVRGRGPLGGDGVGGHQEQRGRGVGSGDRGEGVEQERLGQRRSRRQVEARLRGAAPLEDDHGAPGGRHRRSSSCVAATPAA